MFFKQGRTFALCLGLLAGLEAETFADSLSVTRSGKDQLTSASLALGETLTFAYDPTYGQMTTIAGGDNNGYSLSFDADAMLHLPISQTVRDQESGDTVLTATIAYGADGSRASRTVTAGSQGEGSSTTDYWYGGGLHPLVVERDGVNHRMIGKGIVEEVGADDQVSYAHADHSGSMRMVTDAQGNVVQSLSYTDYGTTSIAGQTYAANDDSVASFYRFQSQEQETFPLAKLAIDNDPLSAWLDRIQLYRFPWRDYAAGLATFLQTDPIPSEDSLYAAFAANPMNFTDETGGMVGDTDAADDSDDDQDAHLVTLLDRVLQEPMPAFSADDRARLMNARRSVIDLVQQLIERSEAITQRIYEIDQSVRQMESSLQGLRQRETYAHYLGLIGDHLQQRRLSWDSLSRQDRTRYLDTVLFTAQDLSDRRMSVAQRIMSERYLLMIRQRDRLIEELDSVNDLQRDLDRWLASYDIPIRQLDPDQYVSDAEADQEDDDGALFDDDLGFQIYVPGDRSPQHSDSEDEADAAPAQESENVNDSRGHPPSPSHRDGDRGGDGGALE